MKKWVLQTAELQPPLGAAKNGMRCVIQSEYKRRLGVCY